MAEFEVRRGDTLPALDTILYDGQQPADLTGATVTVTVQELPPAAAQPIAWSYGAPAPPPPVVYLLYKQAATVDTETPGRVYRLWNDGETNWTDDPDPLKVVHEKRFSVEWEVTNSLGRRTFPTDGPQQLIIREKGQVGESFVDPDQVAERFNLAALSGGVWGADQRRQLQASINAAIARLEGYLKRAVERRTFVEDLLLASALPVPGTVYPGTSGDVWEVHNRPLIQVLDVQPLSTGYYRVTYYGGIDGPNIPAIRDWIETAAADEYWNTRVGGQRQINSKTVEGQSVSYDTTIRRPTPEPLKPGASVDRWRVRSLFSRSHMRDPFIGAGG